MAEAEVEYAFDPYDACSVCSDQSEDCSSAADEDEDEELEPLPIDWDDCAGCGCGDVGMGMGAWQSGGCGCGDDVGVGVGAGPSGSMPTPMSSWPSLPAEREESRGKKSNRGSYVRDASTGKGLRKKWLPAGLQHIEAIQFPSGSFWTSKPCDAFFRFL